MGWIEPMVIQSPLPTGALACGAPWVLGVGLLTVFCIAALGVLVAARRPLPRRARLGPVRVAPRWRESPAV